jgi:hypothetical protein
MMAAYSKSVAVPLNPATTWATLSDITALKSFEAAHRDQAVRLEAQSC